jgi:hypothetical protein
MPGQNYQNRTASTGLFKKESHGRTIKREQRKGQPEQDS